MNFQLTVSILIAIIVTVGISSLYVMIWKGFLRVGEAIQTGMDSSRIHEERLRKKELFVISTMINRELLDNISKLEAFLLVYNDMLKELKEGNGDLLGSGEIIHKAPSLKRAVFDNNTDKLELFDRNITRAIIALYSNIETEPEYITLSHDMPKEELEEKISKIISDAEKLMVPMKRLSTAIARINTRRKSTD